MDRESEAHAINALQDRVAAKHQKTIAASIVAAWRSVANDLPSRGRPDIPLSHFQEVRAALVALYRDITRETAAGMVERFKSGFQWIETKADESGFYDRLFEEYLRVYGGNSIAQITGTTRRQIIAVIERGLKEGLSIEEIAREIEQRAPVIGEIRAAIIARTETHSASMYASLASAKRSTVPLLKEWVSVEDARTRDFGEGDGVVDEFSHRIMDGVKVPIEDQFEVPTSFGITERLKYPGDPTGSAANIINCRCAMTYVEAEEVDEDVTPAQAKPVPTTGGDARARIMDRIRGEQPVFSSAHDDAMADAPLLYLQAIAKAGDFKRLTFDRKDGAYYLGGTISMGRHDPGSVDYKRVFRHEHGHFLDDEIGKATGSPPFGSWRAVKALLADGDELKAGKSKVFEGDKAAAVRPAARNGERVLDRADELAAIYENGDDLLRALIPEVEPEDIWKLYGATSRGVESAGRIAASWELRDVGYAIADLPGKLSGQRVQHSSGFAGLQDTFEASNGGNVRIHFGHGKSYYTQRNAISDFRGQIVKHGRVKVNAYATGQAFANFMDAFGDPNPATYALYKRLYPRTAAEFEALLEEYVNAG